MGEIGSVLERLCELLIEGRITDDECRQLEQLVVNHPAACRYYVRRTQLHADLEEFFLYPHDTASSCRPTYATLFADTECTWKSTEVPTTAGTRLGRDHLHLVSGVAILSFDSDATLHIEGPCRVEVESANSCFLYSGSVVADVGPQGAGFTVNTPSSVIRDLGTSFGAVVREDFSSEVSVFEGLADVRPLRITPKKSTGVQAETQNTNSANNPTDTNARNKKTQPPQDTPERSNTVDVNSPFWQEAKQRIVDQATESEAISLSAGEHLRISSMGEILEFESTASLRSSNPTKVLRLSTSDGRSHEATLQPRLPKGTRSNFPIRSDIYLLIKNSPFNDGLWSRKSYFSIDLSRIKGMTIQECQLQLSFGPTGIGFLSRLPEVSDFAVFGITHDDPNQEPLPTEITWENFPANLHDGGKVNPEMTVLIDRFTVERIRPFEMKTIASNALMEYILDAPRSLATFIVVRETPERVYEEHVHGIANSRHPKLSPPTLRIAIENTH